ncbi:MAG: amidohydrolase family protein [Nannocystaceae bacterium]
MSRRGPDPRLSRRGFGLGIGLSFGAGILGHGSWARSAPPADPSPSPAAPGRRPGEGVTALVGGRLHVGDGKVIEGATVVLRGEAFTSVGGPELRARLAPATTIVDVTGKELTPGLIAADSHLGIVEIDLEPSTRDDSGGDHPVRAAYDAAEALQPGSSLIQVQAIEGITSAAIAPSGGLLTGQVAWIDLVHGDRKAMRVRQGVAVRGNLGQVIAGSRAATLAKLREVLADARLYARSRAAHERRQLRDLAAHPRDLEALGPLLAGKVPLTVRADRESDIVAALDLAAAERIKVVILGGAEAWRVAGRLAERNVPVILQPTHNLPGSFDTLGARLDAAAILRKAGAPVGLAVLGEAHNLRNLRQECGIAVANGMAWEEALTAATLAIARAYGQDRDFGSVAPGKTANLVVWDGDPFELSSAAVQVYIRGEAIPMVSRQTLLRERYRDLSKFRGSR